MFCMICGAEVPQGSMYCPVCGAQLSEPAQQQMQQPAPQQQMQQPVSQQPVQQPAPQQQMQQPVSQQPVQQPVQQQMQQPVSQQMPQQGSMDQVMQQHEYARQMQQQFSQEAKEAEREVTQTTGMSIPNQKPQGPTPYPAVQQGEMSQSIMPMNPQVSQQYPPMMQQVPQKAPKQKGGKKSKLPLILAIIAVALIAAAVVVFVVIKPFGKKKNAQTKALDRYFDAINALDVGAIDAASFPADFRNNYTVGLEDRCGYNMLYTNQMGFGRGCASIDMFRVEQGIMDSYPAFDIRNYPDADAYHDMLNNNENFPKLYKDFSATYELEALYAWDEATLAIRNGLKNIEITDMDELISYKDADDKKHYFDIDDAYIAQIKVKWYYGDKLYGFDKSWWSDPNLKQRLENTVGFESYEKAISNYDNYVWTVVVYEYDGEWYVFPERLSAALNQYRVEIK